jgi:LmbE family N-acetylglucosaminyl deacetylase
MLLTIAAATATMALLSPVLSVKKTPPYPLLPAATSRDRIVIIAPHIDDEAIGAGGFAIDAIENGAEVFVIFLTAGDCNRMTARLHNKKFEPSASDYLSVGKMRIAEAHEAMRLLGIPPDHYFVLGYPDRGLRSMLNTPEAIVRSTGTKAREVPYGDAMSPGAAYTLDNVLCDLRQVLTAVDPTIVIAPVPFDLHDDHASAAELTDLALASLEIRPKRLGYLVHMGRMATKLVNTPTRALVPPTRMKAFNWATYPLSRLVQERKTNVLMTYKSQKPYVFLLRNAFVRSNELFFVYDTPPSAPMLLAR